MAMPELVPAARRFRFLLGFCRFRSALAFSAKDLPGIATGPLSGQKRIVENLWREFFSDPSQWWDHRLEKLNARYPDFKHKTTQQALWLTGKLNPPWVEAEFAALAPGTVQPNIFVCNSKLSKYVKGGKYQETLDLFQQMQEQGMLLNSYTFVPVLNACASLRALDKGRYVHEQIIQRKVEPDVFVGNSLIDMYAKCGSIEDAVRVFNNLPLRDLVSWNTMLLGLVKCGHPQKGLELSKWMHQEGMQSDRVTFIGRLNACASLAALGEGRHVHQQIIQSGWESDIFVSSSLVNMYCKCGNLEDAWIVFQKMPTRNVVSWNAMIQGYVKCGQGEKALELSRQMQQEGIEPEPGTFVAVLNACASLAALQEGRCVHQKALEKGCESDVFVASSLVNMYAKCRSIEDAFRVFSMMPSRDVVSWNVMIQGYVECGHGQKALELARQMQVQEMEPDLVTLVGLLNACVSTVGGLEEGRLLHEQIVQKGWESDLFASSSLVNMYAKCGSIEDAWRVFKNMPQRDVVAWSAMIQGYVKYGQGQKALDLYGQMENEGVKPDAITLVGALNACASVAALEEGRRVHQLIIQRGWESNSYLGSSLVDMYSKCGNIEDAWRVFEEMSRRDVVAWSAMIQGYAKCGQGQKALELYRRMQEEGVEPDPVTFVGFLNACASAEAIQEGRHVHEDIVSSGCETNIFVGSSLVDMYAKCGSIEDARTVFNKMPQHNVVSWNAMIHGHVRCGQAEMALELFQQMQQLQVEPDPVTFIGVLNACASVAALDEGRRVHAQIIQKGAVSDGFVGTALIDMYAKCGSMEDAWTVFNELPRRDVIAWNAMILGYVKRGEGEKALVLYQKMEREGVEPVALTFVGVLNACASVGAVKEGHRFHEQIIARGLESDVFVGGSLIGMYAKCGSIEDALQVFNRMPTRDVVAWSFMILGYVKCGEGQKALELFQEMKQEGIEPDHVTCVGLLNACASLTAIDEGRRVHAYILQRGWESDVYVGSSLVDMYAKCGSIEAARRVFGNMSTCNVVSWNALLGGYAMHGHGKEALGHFDQMCQDGVKTDTVTFVSLLSACSHAGLVEEGLDYFSSMDTVFGVPVLAEHYACIIDLLGRAGRLHEAEDLIRMMSCGSDASVWMSLLGACRVHGNIEMGTQIANRLFN